MTTEDEAGAVAIMAIAECAQVNQDDCAFPMCPCADIAREGSRAAFAALREHFDIAPKAKP